MIRIEKLTVDEKWAIKRQIKQTPLILIREKGQAVLMADNKLSVPTIADIVGKDVQVIRQWLKDWNERKLSSLFSGHEHNTNASKLTPMQKIEVKQALQSPPSDYGIPKEFWDVPTLRKYLRAEFDVVYECPQSYHFLLKYSDLSFKYPSTFDRRRDEELVASRVREIGKEIQALLKDASWEVFCSDEVRLEQEAEIRRAWLKRGERTIVRVDRSHECQNYIGFLSQKTTRCFLYKIDWGNSEEVIKATSRLLSFFPNKRIAIVWDNARFHRSEEIRRALMRGGMMERVHLIPMPPYAPDENPIEHVWNEAKKHSSNIQYDNFEQTKSRFENFIRNKAFRYTFRDVNKKYF